jgi:two-component system sensor histidine kinase QseC
MAAPLSLRRRLLLLVSLATLLVWALAAASSYRQARHDVRELMDAQLAQSAALLLAQATHAAAYLDDLAAEIASLRGAGEGRNGLMLEFVVARADGTVLARSPQGPARADGVPGYMDMTHAGERWRGLLLVTADGGHRILVAQSTRLRDEEAYEIAAKTVLPLVLFMPLLLGFIYFSVRRGLKPLDDLADEVAARSPENLQALPDARAPREARPLVGALNRLLRRLGGALENERRFTADAAHELRTPLAAVRVQAQVAQATQDAAERGHALAQVVAGTDRATRLVEQLLRLARLDPLARVPEPRPVDLAVLARDALAAARAGSPRGADIGGEIADPGPTVDGDSDLLGVALRNLIDNALRYTEAGVPVTVVAGSEHGEPFVAVRDAGAGVPPEELPKLIERFYRGRDSTAEGSGLGLAIVRRIAELHGARLEVENLAGGGFSARLRWRQPRG